jgi:hypothetical protein
MVYDFDRRFRLHAKPAPRLPAHRATGRGSWKP